MLTVRLFFTMNKQSKQYESMRQTQTNTFSDGLNMDLHPLTTPNTILTDCVNGTMVTYNDNEFVLQNERGNKQIEYNGEIAQLSSGYIPIGMKEYGGILYIVSHNPIDKKTELGTFPSPENSKSFNLSFNYSFNEDNTNIYYNSKLNDEFKYYLNNGEYIEIGPHDSYNLKLQTNIFQIVDHYIVGDNGEKTKVHLENNTDENKYFPHKFSGILGYQYRTYLLDKYVINHNKTDNLDLRISFETDDSISTDELKLYVHYYITGPNNKKYHLQDLFSSNELTEGKALNVTDPESDKWTKFSFNKNSYNIINKYNLFIDFTDNQTFQPDGWAPILNWNQVSHGKYENGQLEINGEIFDKFVIELLPVIEKNELILLYDDLYKTIEFSLNDVQTSKDWFSTFRYEWVDESKSMLETCITLDTKSLYKENVNVENLFVSNATVEFQEIQKDWTLGSLSTELTTHAQTFVPPYETHKFVSGQQFEIGDIVVKSPDNIGIVSTITGNIEPFSFVKRENEYDMCVAPKDDYMSENDTFIYKPTLTNNNISWNVVSPEKNDTLYNSEIETSEGRFITFMNHLSAAQNKIYICTLRFSISSKNEEYIRKGLMASFIVVTSDDLMKNDAMRLDLVNFEDWFPSNIINPTINITNETIKGVNNSRYESNKFPIELDLTNNAELFKYLVNYKNILEHAPEKDSESPSFSKIINNYCNIQWSQLDNILYDDMNISFENCKLNYGDSSSENLTIPPQKLKDSTLKTIQSISKIEIPTVWTPCTQTTEIKYLREFIDLTEDDNFDKNGDEKLEKDDTKFGNYVKSSYMKDVGITWGYESICAVTPDYLPDGFIKCGSRLGWGYYYYFKNTKCDADRCWDWRDSWEITSTHGPSLSLEFMEKNKKMNKFISQSKLTTGTYLTYDNHQESNRWWLRTRIIKDGSYIRNKDDNQPFYSLLAFYENSNESEVKNHLKKFVNHAFIKYPKVPKNVWYLTEVNEVNIINSPQYTQITGTITVNCSFTTKYQLYKNMNIQSSNNIDGVISKDFTLNLDNFEHVENVITDELKDQFDILKGRLNNSIVDETLLQLDAYEDINQIRVRMGSKNKINVDDIIDDIPMPDINLFYDYNNDIFFTTADYNDEVDNFENSNGCGSIGVAWNYKRKFPWTMDTRLSDYFDLNFWKLYGTQITNK